MEVKEKDKHKILNLIGAALVTEDSSLLDSINLNDKERLRMIQCFVINIANILGFSDKDIEKYVPKNIHEIANYISQATMAVKIANVLNTKEK